MLIIVEGPDGSGKTTYVDELSHAIVTPSVDNDGKAVKNSNGWSHENTHVQILHSGPLKKSPILAYEDRIRNYDPFHDIVLIDRWHVGELIYGPLLRGRSQLTPAMKKHIDLLLIKLGAVKVFMDTDFETCHKRAYDERGEDLIPEQHSRLVWDAYQEVCTVKDNWLPASGFKMSVVVETAKALEQKAQSLHRFTSYVGPANPFTLVLGGSSDRPKPGQIPIPSAFTPWPGSSGDYLLTTMEAAGCRGYGLADAQGLDIGDLWATLNFPKIVLLGVEAEMAMKKEDDVVQAAVTRKLEHPRFVSNFKLGALHKYADFLREAVNA